MDKEKVIKGLENTAEYFRHLQSIGFFGDQPIFREHEAHCNDSIAMLKEQEEEIENLKQTAQNMMEGICLLKEQNNCENCAIAIEDRQPVVRCRDCKFWQSRVFRIIDDT